MSVEKQKAEQISHRNTFLKELFNAETDEVKAEVKKKRESGHFSDEDIELADSSNDDIDAIERRRCRQAI